MIRTLLVDTNRAAVPIYRTLCAMEHEVWVVGAKPTETLAKLAANYVELDYSDSDRLAAFVDKMGFDFIVPGCTDLSYKVCAEINNGRFPGIDTPEATAIINEKNEFRKIAAALGLPIPRLVPLDQACGGEAVIVKPVDSFSGRGMTVLNDPQRGEIQAAYEVACNASKSGTAILEEYISGQLFSHSAFLCNGHVVADFIVQEDCATNPFTVDTSRMTTCFPEDMLASLRASICRLASSLHSTNGLMHTQFIASGNRYWIIEITRRCPGDLYSLLIEFSTGYQYAASYIAPFIGAEPVVLRDENGAKALVIRHTVTSKHGSSLWGFSFDRPIDIKLFIPLATSCDFIGASPYGRAGIIFFRSGTEKEQNHLYQELLDGNLYSFG